MQLRRCRRTPKCCHRIQRDTTSYRSLIPGRGEEWKRSTRWKFSRNLCARTRAAGLSPTDDRIGKPPKPMDKSSISRRQLLRTLGSSALGAALLPADLRGDTVFERKPASTPTLEEIPASVSGISWIHVNGQSPEMYMPETVGPGCAFLDYDNDGWMDIYLVNGGPCDFYTPATPLRNALYRNNHDGTFTDVTQKAGVPGPGWGTSSVGFDYDNDGRLDLFVCRFVDFDKSKNIFCGYGPTNARWYCKPTPYKPMPCWLFHNNGDGTFTDVSKESGIAGSPAKARGVVAADINNDGWMDLFVGNDTVANFLFANRGKGRFEEIGALAGVGFNAFGLARSGMGVDAGDYDQDGWLDLFVANVDHESFALFHNNKDESFTDVAIRTGIDAWTSRLSGWGLKFFDYDNDGNLDLLLCNGHPDNMVEKRMQDVTYREPMLLIRNSGSA